MPAGTRAARSARRIAGLGATAALVTIAALAVRATAAERDRPASLGASAVFAENVASGGTFVPGELVVASRPGVPRERVAQVLAGARCVIDHPMGRRPLWVAACPRSEPVGAVIAKLEALDRGRVLTGIEASWVEAATEAEPNDLVVEQWHHHNVGQIIDDVAGTPGADIGSLAAWDVTTGSDTLVVAIPDTGIYRGHVELADRLWSNEDEDCANGVDDDDNGYIDDCIGWDVGEGDADPDPSTLPTSGCTEGHATFIAGLIGAAGDNGVGVAGVAWDVKLMSIKRVHDRCGATNAFSIESVAYAVDNGARVVSIAFNGTTNSPIFQALLLEAEAKGIVVVMSAGNDAEDNDTGDRYPNNYRFATRVVVANTTNRDVLSPASNFGEGSVTLAAPGADLYSLAMTSTTYRTGSGTSYAQAVVAGAAALVMAAEPDLHGVDVVEALVEGTEKLAALQCETSTRCVSSGGRLDVPGALQAAAMRRGAYRAEVLDWSIDDSGFGDGDGLVERGEFVAIHATVENTGASTLEDLRLDLVADTASTGVSIADGEATLGDLTPQSRSSTRDRGDLLTVEVTSTCTTSIVLPATLELRDGHRRFWSRALELAIDCTPRPPADAGVADASPADAAITSDAGVADASPSATTSDGGCTAAHGTHAPDTRTALLLAVFALALAGRRETRERRRTRRNDSLRRGGDSPLPKRGRVR
ncbi:S8 family serine peptidase [Myxococcota bacterium]|nr:S8 family serine peptidase [Myxococcota bacterium]